MNALQPNDKPPERTALYRLYNADDVLLYVGIASDPERRWKQHEEFKPWWPEVAKKTVEWLESRNAALTAETQAIRTELPRHNHQNNPSAIISQIKPQQLWKVPNGTWRPYEFMAHELRGFIQSGCLKPGDKLPVVRDLMEVYEVSSATVQRALGVLKADGFAIGRAGFGVCAALPAGFRREAAADADPEGVIEDLANHRVNPSPRTCNAIGVAPGAQLVGKSWVRRIDGRPVEVVRFYSHPDAAPEEPVHSTHDLVTADPPTTETVKILGLAPLLSILRVTRSVDGQPLGVYEIDKNGHLLSLSYEF
ncbi:GntR family transcriptional regulator [Streptomyces sp. C3-3]|uniref:GntR family transcriptional regulator n=1 Tax=Streptomyces sp. C3-3 TaxID=2824901 RepID=UPI001B364BD5|nr:GntR family transcriptional regulator [Streptomyces sp. C3-3]MBQ1118538.1 GntR family transcriptional regulator [Streptomyces sp. C3-3]